MIRQLRSLARAVRTRIVRRFHPWRRRRARAVLHESVPPEKVLFICLGNVCRSPYAEARMMDLLRSTNSAPHLSVVSAGFIGPGRGSPEQAVAVASERGLDLSPHVSRVLGQCTADDATLVVVMEPGQVTGVRRAFGSRTPTIVLGDLDPELPERRLIPDPWGRELEDFRASFDRIDRCLRELVRAVQFDSERGAPDQLRR